MTIDAFAGRMRAFDQHVHALRPHPGEVQSASNLRQLLQDSTMAGIDYHLVPKFRAWSPESWNTAEQQALDFDICWDWVPLTQRHGRERRHPLVRIAQIRRRQLGPASGRRLRRW